MFSADFKIVICELVLIKLGFLTFDFILIRVLWFLVEIGICFAIDAYLKQFSISVVSTRGSNSILNCFECFINACESIEVTTIWSRLKSSLLQSDWDY
jgi:hypothetical protein